MERQTCFLDACEVVSVGAVAIYVGHFVIVDTVDVYYRRCLGWCLKQIIKLDTVFNSYSVYVSHISRYILYTMYA